MRNIKWIFVAVLLITGLAIAQTQSGTSSSSQPSSSGNTATQGTSANTGAGASAQSTPATTSGQEAAGAANTGNAKAAARKNGKLPQTASPLPLVALLGLSSLGAGAVLRKRYQN